jgi:ABC-type dipeptide/oligopeptide/nickel transport system permease subunit
VDSLLLESNFHALNQTERLKISWISTLHGFRNGWRIYSQNKLAVFGLLLLVFFTLFAFAQPILLNTVWDENIYDPVIGHDMKIFPHPSAPSTKHLLGTDTLGRDVLSMLMAATSPSLQMALTAAFTSAFVGLLIAALSAYYRGIPDFIFTHLADLSILAPAPIIMVIIGFLLDIQPFKFGLIYGLLTGIGAVGVVLRAHALTIMSRTFISAARTAGGGAFHIMTKHMIPHLLPLASINMLLTVTGAIFANGFIAFLGLSRAHLNWGSMIYDSFTYQQINATIPWNVLLPSAFSISFFAASFYFIALGLQNIVDPRSSESIRYKYTQISSQPKQLNKIKARNRFNLRNSVNHPTIPTRVTIESSTKTTQTTSEKILRNLTVSVIGFPSIDTTNDNAPNLKELTITLLNEKKNISIDFTPINQRAFLIVHGLSSDTPKNISALLAIKTNLELISSLRCEIPENQKICIGISSGQLEIPANSNSKWNRIILSSNQGLVARRLCGWTEYMQNGGILLDQVTFNRLENIQHHLTFGRKGLAKLPHTNYEQTIYELIGKDDTI